MLRPKQLAVARLALDLMREKAKNKSVLQLARLNGLDETTIVTALGTIVLPWVGKVSKNVPTECRVAPIPVDWDKAEEVDGLLSGDGYKHDTCPTEVAMLIAETLRVELDTGSIGLDVLMCRKEFKYLVTSGHSIYLVHTKSDGTSDASWLSSRVKHDNIIMQFSKEHEQLLSSILDMDDSATVSMTLHPNKTGVLHILSNKLHVAINICMPSVLSGSCLKINKDVKTSPTEIGTFNELITEKGKEMEETKTVATPPVSTDQLMQLAGMAEEGIRKPVDEQDTAPWPTNEQESIAPAANESEQAASSKVEPTEAPPEAAVDGSPGQNDPSDAPDDKSEVSTTPKKVKEQEVTILEALDALQTKMSEHIQQLKDVYIPLLREDQRELRSVTARYRAECKGSKKNPADSDKIEELEKKIKKLQNMVEAAMR